VKLNEDLLAHLFKIVLIAIVLMVPLQFVIQFETVKEQPLEPLLLFVFQIAKKSFLIWITEIIWVTVIVVCWSVLNATIENSNLVELFVSETKPSV